MIAFELPPTLADSTDKLSRASLRLRSLSWALIAGLAAGLLSLPFGVDQSVRSTGCGLFYGLLAFHLERADPEDSHLQAGLVGAVCGLRTLGMCLPSPWADADSLASLVQDLVMGWMPLIGSSLLLHRTQRMLSASRP
ncbi:hypothetical protein [Synechococcus sp. MIT S9503]|uniref:hypothetical protein n=1 Tax=Synechococcus sp. MIT S9503 TaxID=3082547 RepID=UPI0039A53AEB